MLRENFQSTNCRLQYSMSAYENVARATIPLVRSEVKYYLLIALDVGANAGAAASAEAVIARALSVVAGFAAPEIE